MILFEGYFGRILHTGDFRFNPNMIINYQKIFSQNSKLDEVIFDNTFCDPAFKFPPREVAFNMMIKIINSHKEREKNLRVMLGMDNIGKEELL